MNPYDVLEVSPDVEQSALRDAYRRLVRLHHPDLALNQERREQAHVQMQRINQAWDLVSDPEKRASLDARRAEVRRDELLRDLKAAHEQDQKRRALQKRKTASKSGGAKTGGLSKTSGKSTPVTPSATRRKVKALHQKQTRSPEEIRVRNRQKLVEAQLFIKQGRSVDAIASCQSVLKNDFRNVVAREMLGDIYLDLGDKEKALVLFEQSLALQNGSAALRRKIAGVRLQSNQDESLKAAPVIRQKIEQNLEFDGEDLPVRPASESFWRRLRGKLGNRR